MDKNTLLTEFGKRTLENQYLIGNEDYQDLFRRVADRFKQNEYHRRRMYQYISNHWFMPATPILANGGTERGHPISCFLNEVEDNMADIIGTWNENAWISSKGGGIGTYWGNVRPIGDSVGLSGKTSGIIPFIGVMDRLTLAISQGSLRRGASAVYLPVWHPEIEEFIEIRKTTGGDYNRKSLNIHHGVVLNDLFMKAVEDDSMFDLINPRNNEKVKQVKARYIWIKILQIRLETGEPYMLFIDNVNRSLPEHHEKLGLRVKTSNLCSEITLPTGYDHLGNKRTAVCCLGSVNLKYYKQWKHHPRFIEDCGMFLNNVLEDYIDQIVSGHKDLSKIIPDYPGKHKIKIRGRQKQRSYLYESVFRDLSLTKRCQDKGSLSVLTAAYSAHREKSIGLGVMGWHTFLQENMIPMHSKKAFDLNEEIFSHISHHMKKLSKKIGEDNPCPDSKDCGGNEGLSHTMAIAPTATISIIAGGCSPGIEPVVSNSYVHKTLSGSFPIRNAALEKVLQKKGKNTEEVWEAILASRGSVQNLDFLTDEEKSVFLTAFEIDQNVLIDLAAQRQKHISQSQSLNLFFRHDVQKKTLHNAHASAWKKGVKSIYYCRSSAPYNTENRISAGNGSHCSVENKDCASCQ